MKNQSRMIPVALLAVVVTAACSPEHADTRLTTARCIEMGGLVVGDIGDGRVHRPDYLCESGEHPIGPIELLQGEPIPVEGAVCCPLSQ